MTVRSKRIPIAVIKSPHGIKGWVTVLAYSGDPESLTKYGALTDKDGKREFILTPRFDKKGAFVCSIQGITDRNDVEGLGGTELFTDRESMPDTDGEKEFYVTDLEGLEIRSPKGDVMGKIIRVDNFGAGDLLDAKIINPETGKHESHYIPFTDACVPTVDIDGGFVIITPPRGLFAKEEKPKNPK